MFAILALLCYNRTMLPSDAIILVSLVNTALRDGETLEDFCATHDCTQEELEARLGSIGYRYDEAQNRFCR